MGIERNDSRFIAGDWQTNWKPDADEPMAYINVNALCNCIIEHPLVSILYGLCTERRRGGRAKEQQIDTTALEPKELFCCPFFCPFLSPENTKRPHRHLTNSLPPTPILLPFSSVCVLLCHRTGKVFLLWDENQSAELQTERYRKIWKESSRPTTNGERGGLTGSVIQLTFETAA